MDPKIESLIAQMTLEEKIAMLAGADMWHTVAIERLGIPAIRVTDGPIGARGTQPRQGPTSACFPAGVALAATWNPDLVRRVGAALAEETRAKGAHILLAPTVNMHRSPLAGRNFECYSEDPYLTARMAIAYIDGLQGGGVGACIKHFVCNDSEFERRSMSSQVSERALREIYLLPFQMAIHQAKPWAVMSAYNKVNGRWCNEDPYLLLDILKGEWGFDGAVISDWFGTYTPGAAYGGLDLEMPGPARWMGEHVRAALKAGDLSPAALDDKVRRLLRTIHRAGAFAQPDLAPERAIDKPEHRRLVRKVGGEAIVLLKNADDLLPLDRTRIRSIAVIGENARWAQIQGGGSVHVSPHYRVSPLDGIRHKAGEAVAVGYEIGCNVGRRLPLVESDWLTAGDGRQQGLYVEYFASLDLSEEPVHAEVADHLNLVWFGKSVAGVDDGRFSARLTGHLTVPETGRYRLGLMSAGLSRLYVDGRQVIDNWTGMPPHGGPEKTVEMELVGGRAYPLRIEYCWEGGADWRVLRLGCLPPARAASLKEAVALAARSDVAIVVVGQTDEWEHEGEDRADMELPRDQATLIEQVAAANANTIVVVNTGSPITMNWLDQVAAVVQVWYLGQEMGHAIADVLFGDVNPSGKLPTTFPVRLQDNPAYLNYPGENGQVLYGEGLFIGYRYYDAKGIEPLFPFGYGLSYTTFAYRNLRLDATRYAPGEAIRVSLDVENTGARAGKEIVQLYVRDMESSLRRPEKELKAFAKVALEPGETQTVQLTLDGGALSYYDPAHNDWLAEPGEFEVLVGSSSHDIRLTGRFTLLDEPGPA
ncbi:MAG: glycoside hydrolase family 3 C-terminal domain-containing protein [Anaerolineae bacterium]|jgi:beta-glucosidase